MCRARHHWGEYLHVQKVLHVREMAEILNHKVCSTLEEFVWAVSLSDGEQRETVREIQASDEELGTFPEKNRDLRAAKRKGTTQRDPSKRQEKRKDHSSFNGGTILPEEKKPAGRVCPRCHLWSGFLQNRQNPGKRWLPPDSGCPETQNHLRAHAYRPQTWPCKPAAAALEKQNIQHRTIKPCALNVSAKYFELTRFNLYGNSKNIKNIFFLFGSSRKANTRNRRWVYWQNNNSRRINLVAVIKASYWSLSG